MRTARAPVHRGTVEAYIASPSTAGVNDVTRFMEAQQTAILLCEMGGRIEKVRGFLVLLLETRVLLLLLCHRLRNFYRNVHIAPIPPVNPVVW